jgi:Flp pilus assembly protein TadD
VLIAWTLRRRPALGFAGAWVFIILAPTSSIVPLQDLAFEHRMYLPLAGIVAAAIIGGHALLRGKAGVAVTEGAPRAPWGAASRTLAVTLVLAAALGAVTVVRNRDYRSEVAIWADTVAKRPQNARAQLSLGVALDREGLKSEAARHTAEALRLNPKSAKTQTNYGIGLLETGRAEEACEHFRRAIELEPGYVSAHSNLGIALCQLGRFEEGVHELEHALRLDPRCVEAHFNLAIALRELGRVDEARQHYEEALRLDPQYTLMDGAP